MFRYFETFVDPYTGYTPTDAPPRRLWAFLWDYAQPFKRLFAITAAMSILVAAVEVWLIYYLGRLVDILAQTGPADLWAEHGVELGLVALFVLVLRPLSHGLHVLLLNNGVVPNFGTLIRWRSHAQVLRQSVGWFENDFAGRVANRIMQTPMAAGDAAFQVFDAIAFAIAYVVGAAFLLADADLRLLVPMLGWLVLYALLVRWTVKRVGPASQASSDARSEVTGRVVDSYSNIHSVKLFAGQETELAFAKTAIDQTRRTVEREMRIFTTMDISLFVLNGVFIVSVVGWALLIWTQGGASAGIVAAATALALRLNAMTGWIMWALTNFFRSLGIVAEGMETITQPITLTDRPGAPALKVSKGAIRFEEVSHHYGRGSDGLDRLSIEVAPGEKIGLVGRSGAGKTTLVKLLLRFYDPEGGRILIDGQDVTQVTQDSLRRAIGMVQQDTSLLHRSVRDNILYGRRDASEAEIRAAADRAEASDFIATLQDPKGRTGYDAHVGERGVKLSGGQRQRIALARVILKDAPILVLDEATSALDSEVEAAIQDTLYGMMEGKTVIAIAHRLSTIAHLDRILVIDKGRIVESGTHRELLAQEGLYAGFWARQSGGFLGTEPEPEAAE
ncbi:ABC transporter ATP-binding protein [Frigidibacter sp. ROC022]|uniref:ABC transporter ATP-binding protein n=1 Tax=Frigidibacter sp. ROC022 TaxID=2971796 RepID=UPI00215AF079|nr:ABC transporter ATP-binding protein [Frigidibacter sp. ROC022]MCR8724449.1 ABC transporter ATP-binding protein/permease [Frigidibacter sp. ROC022]